MRKTIILIGFAGFFVGTIHSQTLISSAGGSVETENYKVSWSVGEVIIGTLDNENYIVSQGFHQDWASVTSIDDLPDDLYDLTVYPMPVSEHLNIKKDYTGELEYKISNINGQLVATGTLTEHQEVIPFDTYSAGVYFMTVFNKTSKIKTYQIVKH